MSVLRVSAAIAALFLLGIATLQSPRAFTQSSGINIEEFISRVVMAETEMVLLRNNYTYTQDVDLKTLGPGGYVTGRYRRTSDILFDDLGARIERIVFFPVPTLTAVQMTREDEQDLAGVNPFALTETEYPKYDLTYQGTEAIDELNTHVFDIRPKQTLRDQRYFEGRLWVDDQDHQIVKMRGQSVPETKNHKYPVFETYRENITGAYWFPTYTYGDDVLHFPNQSVHIRLTVRYTNYKKFETGIRIGEGGEAVPDEGSEGKDKSKPPPRPEQP